MAWAWLQRAGKNSGQTPKSFQSGSGHGQGLWLVPNIMTRLVSPVGSDQSRDLGRLWLSSLLPSLTSQLDIFFHGIRPVDAFNQWIRSFLIQKLTTFNVIALSPDSRLAHLYRLNLCLSVAHFGLDSDRTLGGHESNALQVSSNIGDYWNNFRCAAILHLSNLPSEPHLGLASNTSVLCKSCT